MIHRDEKGRVFEAHYEKTPWGQPQLVLDEEIDVTKLKEAVLEVLLENQPPETVRLYRAAWERAREGKN